MSVRITTLSKIHGYVTIDMNSVIHLCRLSIGSIQVVRVILIKSTNMKRTFIIIILFLGISFSAMAQSQAEIVAGKIADNMKDSLLLTTTQRSSIYAINLQLAASKADVRKNYQQVDSVRFYMQKVENKRDSLYRSVLTEPQFLLYRKRKMVLLNNN